MRENCILSISMATEVFLIPKHIFSPSLLSNQDKPYNGLITFFDFDDILWE